MSLANADHSDMTLLGRRIVLGITGSIAAYKSALLARELRRRGAEVRVVMTPGATEFITPLRSPRWSTIPSIQISLKTSMPEFGPTTSNWAFGEI